MNEPNKNIINNKARNNIKNNDCNIIELDKNLINTNLSQSIKIFYHKSNNIIGLKTNLTTNKSEENILKNNMGLISLRETKKKNLIDKKNNLLLYSFEFGKKEKEKVEKNKNINKIKNNYLEIKGEKMPSMSSLFNKNNIIISKNSKKNGSCANIIVNNEFIPSKLIDKNTTKNKNINIKININKNKNKDKNKLIKDIEDAKFEIVLLKNKLFNTNRKYLYYKVENDKKKYKENLLILKKKFKNEDFINDKLLYLHKLKLFKIEENFINVNKYKEDILKEDLIFKKKKCKLIEKILELKIMVDQNKKNILDCNNQNKNNDSSFGINNDIDLDDMSTDEMLITKNTNIRKINQFYPNKYK